jgi:hypothetical protein
VASAQGRAISRKKEVIMTERPVLFDQAAYRSWLQQPSITADGQFSKYDAVPDLDAGWQRHDGQGGWLATVVLDALAGDKAEQARTVWVYGPGVSGLTLWATDSLGSGADGGVTAEVTVDGVPLSLGRIPADELVATDQDLLPGYEAAQLALTELAERVNSVVDHYRASRPAPVGDLWGGEFGSLTGVEVRAALVTLAELFSGVDVADLSELQIEVTDKVLALWRETDAVDGEIVD